MPTPSEIMDISAADMNDVAQENYTDEALLPYFNMALRELLERFEENSIPVTNKKSASISCVAGTVTIEFGGSPALPADLIEIYEIWESNDGGTSWIPMRRTDFINPNLTPNQELSYFGQYAWVNNAIIVPEASTTILIKIDYLARLVTLPIDIDDVDLDIDVRGCELFVGHKCAGLTAMLSLQDTERATVLNTLAEEAITRQLNIPTKAAQVITTRRRPFRAGYKANGRVW